MVMPHGNGIALARVAALRWPDVRFVIMSGDPQISASEADIFDDRHVFLGKPFGFADLVEAIGRVSRGNVIDAGVRSEGYAT
jgi:DNA-binding NarL/FixJ family response regulator